MMRALKDAGVTQPDDVLLVMSNFSAVMVVRFELVRVEVSVTVRASVSHPVLSLRIRVVFSPSVQRSFDRARE